MPLNFSLKSHSSGTFAVMKFASVFAAFALAAQVTASAIGKGLIVERGSGDLQNIVSGLGLLEEPIDPRELNVKS